MCIRKTPAKASFRQTVSKTAAEASFRQTIVLSRRNRPNLTSKTQPKINKGTLQTRLLSILHDEYYHLHINPFVVSGLKNSLKVAGLLVVVFCCCCCCVPTWVCKNTVIHSDKINTGLQLLHYTITRRTTSQVKHVLQDGLDCTRDVAVYVQKSSGTSVMA